MLPLRRPDGAGGHVLHVPRLRDVNRLRLIRTVTGEAREGPGNGAFAFLALRHAGKKNAPFTFRFFTTTCCVPPFAQPPSTVICTSSSLVAP